MSVLFLCFVLTCLMYDTVNADTPANCTYEDIAGSWIFHVGQLNLDKTVQCTSAGQMKSIVKVNLMFPDVALDQFGNKGFWTMIYNQGFEVVVHGRKYFAFSKYTGSLANSTSYCDETMPGWTHDVIGREWGCFIGKKLAPSVLPKTTVVKSVFDPDQLYRPNHEFVAKINNAQKTWKAVQYEEYETMSLGDLVRRAGGPKSHTHRKLKSMPSSKKQRKRVAALPGRFDWRNRDGVNYIPKVRNQGGCGSCYAFASVEMNAARLRIATNNTVQLTLSPQDVIDCSEYSQGCDGGFPYLIGGKYAEDFGLVEEACRPYASKAGKCATPANCSRHYSTDYRYVGGYYGACNEEGMMLALIKDGPIAVGFEVYQDFYAYKGGVYEHTSIVDRFNPLQLTNHAVLVVGYGVDGETGLKYWVVENSWGEDWGEKGFFRIRRGTDECAIESMAVEAFPIF